MAQPSFNGFVKNVPEKKGINTGNATATSSDIILGKTAYGTVKLIGTLTIFSPGTGQIAISSTARNSPLTAYNKIKSINIPVTGTYRVSFELSSNSVSFLAYGKLYKNGVSFGIERSTTSTSYILYSEDLSFTAGDTCELWAHNDSGSNLSQVQNLKVSVNEILNFTVTLD